MEPKFEKYLNKNHSIFATNFLFQITILSSVLIASLPIAQVDNAITSFQ